ncbi:MAG: GDSL-type esterase/lipase family protein [Kiritimatiellae bacterium]|nr:GDSL-type esterase/lipase family protein [Kiritimatiellia bacterium]
MTLCKIIGCVLLAAAARAADSLLQPDDRIVFVGDSITAQGVGNPNGYYHLFTNALHAAHPAARHEAVGLGFSGHTVYSWVDSIEPDSRTRRVPANTGGFEVQAAFARPAGVVVILLGMNDILCPTVRDNDASLLAWKEKYRALVRAIRARVTPRVTVLCEITPLTEDPRSPKNRVRDRMTRMTADLAAEESCVTAATGAALFDVIGRCRRARQDYHVIPDTVHPQQPLGHLSIARAMAAALRDDALTAALDAALDARIAALTPAEPGVTVWFKPQPGCAANGEEQQYTLDCHWRPGSPPAAAEARFALELPKGWRAECASQRGDAATFTLWGAPARLQTPVTVTADAGGKTYRQTLQIPAPWRVMCGPDNGGAWGAGRGYRPADSVPVMEAALIAGTLDAQPFTHGGHATTWQINTSCVDYTAGDDPNTVAPYSLTFGGDNDVLYAVRWVHSAKARPVRIQLSHRTFSATLGFVVWLNGERVMTDGLNRSGKNRAAAPAALRAGWNRLLVRNDHLQWQRQFACALLPADGDTLDDLRYAVMPPPAVE